MMSWEGHKELGRARLQPLRKISQTRLIVEERPFQSLP
jgi:hypothetical protein